MPIRLNGRVRKRQRVNYTRSTRKVLFRTRLVEFHMCSELRASLAIITYSSSSFLVSHCIRSPPNLAPIATNQPSQNLIIHTRTASRTASHKAVEQETGTSFDFFITFSNPDLEHTITQVRQLCSWSQSLVATFAHPRYCPHHRPFFAIRTSIRCYSSEHHFSNRQTGTWHHSSFPLASTFRYTLSIIARNTVIFTHPSPQNT